MTIQEKIADILERLSQAPLPVIDLSLGRITRFLELLGNPERKLPPVIHIAGTNGKGSLIAYLQAIFGQAGLRVHSYISPHLVRFSERIIINGQEISDEKLLEVLQVVDNASKNFPLTFFEATTAAAFLAFSSEKADIVLLETGLGGRLDATNVIAQPVLTAITPIGMDHMNFLGDTLSQIAQEKAGIIKPLVPCVVGKQSEEVQKLLQEIAEKRQSPLIMYGIDWQIDAGEHSFCYREQNKKIENLIPALVGKHQYENAATAIACIQQLPQCNISEENIRTGLQKAVWNARLQKLTTGKLVELMPKNWHLWLDGGHNPHAGKILADWCRDSNRKPYLIVGMVKGKDAAGFLSELQEFARSVHLVPIIGEETSMSAEELSSTLSGLSLDLRVEETIESAIGNIVSSSTEKTADILICGSLYLAGKVLAKNNFAQNNLE